MNERYKISTITDFLKIPFDKIDKCLTEFKEVLELHRDIISVLDDFEFNYFTWIDDEKEEKTVKIHLEQEANCANHDS